jgi:hypothetical protein
MIRYFITGSSGWVAVIQVGAIALLPYLLRRTALSKKLGLAQRYTGPYLARMWPHYWLGYSVIAVTGVHAYLLMSAAYMRRTSQIGLWLATIALGLLCSQALLGLVLQEPCAVLKRRRIRRWHFWGMVAAAALIGIHIGLNR